MIVIRVIVFLRCRLFDDIQCLFLPRQLQDFIHGRMDADPFVPESGKLLTARQCVHCLSDRNLNTDFLVFIVIEYARFIHLIQQVSYCQAADNRDLTQALEPLILKKLLYHLFDCHKPSELDRTRFCDRRIILIGQDVKHLSKCDIRIQFGVLHLGYNTIHYDKRKIVEIRQCGYRLEART